MAPRSGCESCRDRHQKCTISPGSQSCEQCIKTKRSCHRRGSIHFKAVRSVSGRGGERSKVKFAYSNKQVWVPTPAEVGFVIDLNGLEEDAESLAALPASPISRTPLSKTPISPPPRSSSTNLTPYNDSLTGLEQLAASGLYDLSATAAATTNNASIPQHQRSSSNSRGNQEFSPISHSRHVFSPSSHDEPDLSPHLGHTLTTTNYSTTTRSPESQVSSSWSLTFSGREATLLRNYIENIAPWADTGDPLQHFGVVVPQRAMKNPILRHAIFAISALQLSLVSTCNDLAASHTHYYTECISLLIPTLSHEDVNFDENLLAAVVLLRLYEELGSEDTRCHLLGTARLLNSTTSFSSSNGLGEAASWVSLRQLIYISLVSKEPMTLHLGNYDRSNSVLKGDDYGWANSIVLLFAKILAIALDNEKTATVEEWLTLESQVEYWDSSKPDTFKPLSVGGDTGSTMLPEIWMLGASHVVGIQYYYLAKLFIQAYKPVTPTLGFSNLMANTNRENCIRAYLRLILRVAIGNPKVQNGWFTASHILSACGCYLQYPEEKRIALEFLKNTQKVMGWGGDAVGLKLQEEWRLLG